MTGEHRAVLVEADGGSRGNPGPAAYGAVLLDADTREVIAEAAETIGRATNNVAEYRGLIAGLELHREHTPDAGLEVRMDSKLVVEQMSGRWKVKHPDMRPLAAQARALAPEGTTYTWIPRERNGHADRILNEALDGTRPPVTEPVGSAARAPIRPGSDAVSTTLVLVRHGVTVHTVGKRISSGLTGSNPGLSEEGRAQVRATADWLAPLADGIDVLVASPVRRTQESAEILGERLGKPLVPEPGLAEMDFGTWDGLTYAELHERHPDRLDAWLGSLDEPAGGAESFRVVERRVLAALDRLLAEHAGRTVLAVSHVTPIKILVATALGAPLESVFRMELAPASVTVLTFFDDPSEGSRTGSMRTYNVRLTELAESLTAR